MASRRRQVAAEVSGWREEYEREIYIQYIRACWTHQGFSRQVGHRGGQRVDVEERAENSRGQLFLPREEFPRFRWNRVHASSTRYVELGRLGENKIPGSGFFVPWDPLAIIFPLFDKGHGFFPFFFFWKFYIRCIYFYPLWKLVVNAIDRLTSALYEVVFHGGLKIGLASHRLNFSYWLRINFRWNCFFFYPRDSIRFDLKFFARVKGLPTRRR